MRTNKALVFGWISVVATLVSACEGSERGPDVVSTTTTVHVARENHIAPMNDLDALRVAAGDLPRDLSGEWHGQVMFQQGDQLRAIPIQILINSDGAQLSATSVTEYAESEEFRNLSYDPPTLTYEYTGYATTMDGAPVIYYAEMIVGDGTMSGVYRETIADIGGEQFFVGYDADMSRRLD